MAAYCGTGSGFEAPKQGDRATAQAQAMPRPKSISARPAGRPKGSMSGKRTVMGAR